MGQRARVWPRRAYEHRRFSTLLEEYLEKTEVRKLQLGSGPNILKGWFNTDIDSWSSDVVHLDCEKPFPIEDCSFNYVYAEHLIEHFNYHQGKNIIAECMRILRPSGVLRLATPNLGFITSLTNRVKNSEQQQYIDFIFDTFVKGDQTNRAVHVVNALFYNWGHKFIYNQDTLLESLLSVGFHSATVVSVGKSEHSELQNVERHSDTIQNSKINQIETFVIEAVKPKTNT